jgi:hypothetical protein
VLFLLLWSLSLLLSSLLIVEGQWVWQWLRLSLRL